MPRVFSDIPFPLNYNDSEPHNLTVQNESLVSLPSLNFHVRGTEYSYTIKKISPQEALWIPARKQANSGSWELSSRGLRVADSSILRQKLMMVVNRPGDFSNRPRLSSFTSKLLSLLFFIYCGFYFSLNPNASLEPLAPLTALGILCYFFSEANDFFTGQSPQEEMIIKRRTDVLQRYEDICTLLSHHKVN